MGIFIPIFFKSRDFIPIFFLNLGMYIPVMLVFNKFGIFITVIGDFSISGFFSWIFLDLEINIPMMVVLNKFWDFHSGNWGFLFFRYGDFYPGNLGFLNLGGLIPIFFRPRDLYPCHVSFKQILGFSSRSLGILRYGNFEIWGFLPRIFESWNFLSRGLWILLFFGIFIPGDPRLLKIWEFFRR